MTLGNRIQAHRKKAGLSQERLAERIGVSRQAVAKWEKDQSTPTTDNLLCLAELFGTTVDLLLDWQPEAERKADLQALAAEVYEFYQREEEKKREARRIACRKNRMMALLAVGVFLLAYLIGRLLWSDRTEAAFMGWLLETTSENYLFGWLTHNGLWWWAMAFSGGAALLGQHRLSWTTWGSFFIGFALGDRFGPFPAGASWGYGDYGWAIWGLCWLFGIGMGIWAERLYRREAPEKLHRLWTVVYGIGMVVIVVFVRSQMIVPVMH